MQAVVSNSQQEATGTKQVWPVERKVDLVLQGLRRSRPVTQLCREAGISPARYYQWQQQFINAGRAGLTCTEAERRALEERIRQLEAENAHLQKSVQVYKDICAAD